MSETTDVERLHDTTLGRAEKVALVEGLLDRALRRDAEMTLNEYQRSLHTYKNRHTECHALGLVGELAEVLSETVAVTVAAGNIADMVKKATSHGVPLDPEKLKKELGDVLWYITAVASDNKLTMDDIARANIEKLQKRYPQGFVKGGGVRDVTTDIPEMRDGAFFRELERQGVIKPACKVPPPGWHCTRAAGHEGPCAAMPVSVNLRTETEPGLPDVIVTKQPTHCVSFACGCSETTIDGVRKRTYCPDGNCRRMTR